MIACRAVASRGTLGGMRWVLLAVVLVLAWGAPVHAQSLAAVAVLVRGHRDAEALAQLDALAPDARAEPAVSYLRGRLLERLERPSEAADALAVAGLDAPFAVDAARRRALLLGRAGRCDEARPLLAALPASAEVSLLRGTCALHAGAHAEALRELREAAAGPAARRVSARFVLAETLAQDGDVEGAERVLRSVLLEAPEHPKCDAARARLAQLGRPFVPSEAERLLRAERLLAAREPRAAIDELAPLRPVRREDLRRVLHLRGMALYATRHDYAEAARVLTDAAGEGGSTAAADAFHAARATSRAGDDARAIRLYRAFVRAHPSDGHAAEAEYLAAWLAVRAGRADGRARMERFLSGRGRADADLAQKARWDLAFGAFERRAYPEAARLFAAYATESAQPMVRARGLYWEARALAARGQRAEAIAHYEDAARVEPLHWYALLAVARLRELGVDTAPLLPAPGTTEAPAPLAPTLPDAAARFASLGLDEDAAAALREDEASVRREAPEGRALEALCSAYLQLGAPHRAHQLVAARLASANPREPRDRWIWDCAYPRPFHDDVARASAESHVPEDLLYAFMRQESGYDPRARSSADALGLLQMLVPTARRAADALGIRGFSGPDLYRPELATRLGARHASRLLETFDEPVLAIAAYNTGGARVREWLDASRPPIELDRFVERIPVDQTRNYVRRVTTHWARYRFLRDPADVFLPPLTLDAARVDAARATRDGAP